jgi:hypothetical protein
MEKTKKRKGPGRPPNTPKVPPQPRDGVSDEPKVEGNFVEFKYCEPKFIRTIFTFFKNLATSQIQIIFREDSVVFYAQDHRERSDARIVIDCNKIHHYYCESEFSIGVDCKEFESLVAKLDTSYTAVTIFCTKRDINRKLILSLDTVMKIEEIHKISVVAAYKEMEDEKEFLDDVYKISFVFGGSNFKRMVDNIVRLKASRLDIQKYGNNPLEFAYRRENKKHFSRLVVKDASKVSLESKLGARERFFISVNLEDLRPISIAYSAGEKVKIFVDQKKRFMTESFLDDKTVVIRTLTDVLADEDRDSDDEDDEFYSDSEEEETDEESDED